MQEPSIEVCAVCAKELSADDEVFWNDLVTYCGEAVAFCTAHHRQLWMLKHEHHSKVRDMVEG